MRILAIDPGNTMSAWCLLHDGTPHKTGKEPNDFVLHRLRERSEDFAEGTTCAIEMIASYGMPVGKEVFETCLWIGRFKEAWEVRGGTVKLIYRMDVKRFHCHTTRANDASIRAALIDRFGPGRENAVGTKKHPGPLYGIKGDEWSALAVALTADAALGAQPTTGLFHVEPEKRSYADVALPHIPF